MAGQQAPELREQLRQRLSDELGGVAQLVSVERSSDKSVKGVAVCSGRILSFVLDAEQERLRTLPMFELLQRRFA
ncbi:hypothetical protein MY494_02210 [Synechococcus sp. A10-1-5-1]|uniref:hypothetical protein n=1 Tax=Synechococcus sp. A10-1-5-1 TaxID=2936507 RepID=UPI0020010C45|nr:hypothetical protein [Synechococcus sp. A10-1-5-1]UPM50630.1 hypothetical protein MY494_02210 [Synechococcus sp. A10-1-5-1]